MEWLLASIDPARPHDLAPALRWHGRSMALAWGILAPLAVMVARYGKVWPGQDWPRVLDNPIWWRCHWIALSLVPCLSLLGLSLVLGAPGRGGVHAVSGYALLGLMALQVGLGLLRGSKGGPTAPTLRGDHYDMTPRRVAFEWCHKIGGYIAVVLAMVVILLGLWQANAPHWMWLALGLWWPALTAVAIVLQRRGMAIDTYQAIWGPDPAHPGNRRRPIGWGIRRPHERK